MRRALLRTALISLACLTAAVSAEASGRRVHPADRAENRTVPLTGALPACDDPAVLGQITSWFNTRESRFWGPLQAVAYDRIQPIGFRPLGDDFIPRRFCTGRMANFRVPRYVRFVTEWPMTGSGKIQKPALRDRFLPEFKQQSPIGVA